MAGKASPALFELIRDPSVIRPPKDHAPPEAGVPAPSALPPAAAPEPSPSPAAQPAVELKPVRIIRAANEDLPPPPPAAERPEPPRKRPDWNRPLTVSMTSISVAAAAVVIALVLVSTTAYRAGYAKANDRATRELRLTAAPLSDPLRPESALDDHATGTQPVVQPPRLVDPPRTSGPARGGQTAPAPAPEAVAARAVLVPPAADPRQEGLNYYAIVGQLDRASAEQIAAFLAENGVDALAVESTRRGSNNPRYRVLGLKGLSGEELRTPAKARYEQKISQLGQIWKKDHRGWTDFSDTYWERYRP